MSSRNMSLLSRATLHSDSEQYETDLGQELGCHVGWFVETSHNQKSHASTFQVSHAYRQHILVLFEFIVHVAHSSMPRDQFHTFKHPTIHILASTVYKYTMSRRHWHYCIQRKQKQSRKEHRCVWPSDVCLVGKELNGVVSDLSGLYWTCLVVVG